MPKTVTISVKLACQIGVAVVSALLIALLIAFSGSSTQTTAKSGAPPTQDVLGDEKPADGGTRTTSGTNDTTDGVTPDVVQSQVVEFNDCLALGDTQEEEEPCMGILAPGVTFNDESYDKFVECWNDDTTPASQCVAAFRLAGAMTDIGNGAEVTP